ncbi:hypothetical protein C8A05DRAFT_33677 [Staphylotrichum tortipilum]|uniref:Rhomboid family membrane protein n=1 Tax=Staphylotrichum tortipilum TaxID=2831512 RepID=A0AAN6MKK5_9PEZI|nr:hypothetical protein C8A05DRAFT_33677 [Staphylotrichum longicolle]
MSSPNPAPPSTGAPKDQDPPLPTPNPILHNAALVMAVVCPIALLLPTRGGGAMKATVQNALIGSGAFFAYNQLAADYTGKSITARSAERWGSFLGISSEKKEKQKVEAAGGEEVGVLKALPTERAARNRELMEAERRRRAEAEGREYKPRDTRGLWERVWMGEEREGWREKRMEEEKRALEEGKGYGDLIVEQIAEVWKGREGEKGEGKQEGEGKGEKKE